MIMMIIDNGDNDDNDNDDNDDDNDDNVLRLATAMFYLSDVVGGRTVFPHLRVAVQPR